MTLQLHTANILSAHAALDDENPTAGMKVSHVLAELQAGMDESQNQRDKRVEELWTKLDPQRHGELDFKGLQKGLRRIDHREPMPANANAIRHAHVHELPSLLTPSAPSFL